eukprot:5600210-Pleurochrysis_carterae.AAC.1
MDGTTDAEAVPSAAQVHSAAAQSVGAGRGIRASQDGLRRGPTPRHARPVRIPPVNCSLASRCTPRYRIAE